jgi:hypothetical protein
MFTFTSDFLNHVYNLLCNFSQNGRRATDNIYICYVLDKAFHEVSCQLYAVLSSDFTILITGDTVLRTKENNRNNTTNMF